MITMKPQVETAQEQFELEQLLRVFDEAAPASVLEVGVWHGGTLWHWIQGCSSVTAIDNTMFEADDWAGWAREAGSDLRLIHGDSRDESTRSVAEHFGGYDWLFIDAGHSYTEVRSDWDLYSPMVVPGGIVAFHDIMPRPGYGVDQLWAEVKQGRRWIEISAGRPDYCGIGVLWM